jgi:hypothetical protein
MSPEERLNRLERVAIRFAVTGRRTRNDLRTSINALIDAQTRNEQMFNDRFAKLAAAQAEATEQIKELRAAQKDLAESHLKLHEEVTASQKQTDEKIRILIDIVGLDRNGANN